MNNTNSDNFTFRWGNGLITFNSLSPGGQFYYQITKPKDLYWGLFVARISFCTIDGKLIYYDKVSVASPLQRDMQSPIQYAIFLSGGDMVYYQKRFGISELYHVLIDLSGRRYKQTKWSNGDEKFLTDLLNGKSTGRIDSLLNELDWCAINKVDSRSARDLLFRKQWFPDV